MTTESTPSTFVSENAQPVTNKQFVIDFYNTAMNEKNYDDAARYLGDHFIEHSPLAPDGKEEIRTFSTFLKDNFPDAHFDIKRAFADGDYVILHVHSVRVPGTLGKAAVHIFRLENGRIVEHWDVIQEIPDPSQMRHANGIF